MVRSQRGSHFCDRPPGEHGPHDRYRDFGFSWKLAHDSTWRCITASWILLVSPGELLQSGRVEEVEEKKFARAAFFRDRVSSRRIICSDVDSPKTVTPASRSSSACKLLSTRSLHQALSTSDDSFANAASMPSQPHLPRMPRVYLVRHGETEWSLSGQQSVTSRITDSLA